MNCKKHLQQHMLWFQLVMTHSNGGRWEFIKRICVPSAASFNFIQGTCFSTDGQFRQNSRRNSLPLVLLKPNTLDLLFLFISAVKKIVMKCSISVSSNSYSQKCFSLRPYLIALCLSSFPPCLLFPGSLAFDEATFQMPS